jgi:hypothetical protein
VIKRIDNITNPIDVRFFRTDESYVPITAIKDFFSGYDWATIHVWWDSFDAYTGSITMMQKSSSKVPDWASVVVPSQEQAIEDQGGLGGGRRVFMNVDLHGGEIYLHVNRNTATTGKVYFEAMARKQYGDYDVIQKSLDAMNANLESICMALKFSGSKR